jgi:hypothetical protein
MWRPSSGKQQDRTEATTHRHPCSQVDRRPVKEAPVGRPGARYAGPVRHLLELLVLAGLAAGGAYVARGLLDQRAPRRELRGDGPVLGSLDSWPPVPKKAAA